MREERRRSDASPNWLAIIEAIELPVDVIESGIKKAFAFFLTLLLLEHLLPHYEQYLLFSGVGSTDRILFS